MPNIFICGYERRAPKIKCAIDLLMARINLQNKAITSIAEIIPESCDGKKTRMPYLWIRSTNMTEILEIIDILKKGGMKKDVEWDVIGGFIPAEEMQ